MHRKDGIMSRNWDGSGCFQTAIKLLVGEQDQRTMVS